jgi:hypothetical protein
MIETRMLHQVVILAETRSYAKAAQMLHLSQRINRRTGPGNPSVDPAARLFPGTDGPPAYRKTGNDR